MELLELERLEHSIHALKAKCAFAHFNSSKLHPGQVWLMSHLQARGICTQAELARLLGVSNAAIGISVRRLERAGFVKTSIDSADRRANQVELTDKGREFAERAGRAHDELMNIKYKGLNEEQLSALYEIWTVVEHNFQEYYHQLKGQEDIEEHC